MSFILFLFTPFTQAETPEDELSKKAKEYGDLTIVTSKDTDPVGIEGLWGMEGDFIVDSSCKTAYDALADVSSYPTHSSAVKKVEILEQTKTTLKTDYTEGFLGFEFSSQMQWDLAPSGSPPSITSTTVGEGDSPSWMQMQFKDTKAPDYCEIHVLTYADMSIVPNFMLGWMKDKAAEELVTGYRDIIHGHQKEKSK